MNNTIVTIVTVTYNCESVIEKTLNSVINQSLKKIEYIVVDGKSTDCTCQLINKYKNKIDLFICEPDSGIYDAMNKGISHANGEWIIFMNAGDVFYDCNVLANVFEDREYNKNIGVIHGDYCSTFNGHNEYHHLVPFYKRTELYRGMGFSHQATFVRTILAKETPFDLSYKLAADYNMIWNLYYHKKVEFLKIDIPIAIMDQAEGATVRNYKEHLTEVCNTCGVPKGLRRTLFIYYKLIRYRLQHIKNTFKYDS